MKEDFSKSGKIHYKEELSEVEKQRIKLAFKGQQETEFSRYKQDCRKRALDLAHLQVGSIKWYDEADRFKFENSLNGDAILQDKLLTLLADKYYNWLISIPNE